MAEVFRPKLFRAAERLRAKIKLKRAILRLSEKADLVW